MPDDTAGSQMTSAIGTTARSITDMVSTRRLAPTTRMMATAALLMACVSCGGVDDQSHKSSELPPGVTPEASSMSGWLTADQRRRADQLVSAFENATTDIQYGYAENLGDGRGVTLGRAGFTTATCDAAEVIETYSTDADATAFTPFVDELDRLCREGSDETGGLPEDAFIRTWRAAASDDRFRAAQDEIVDREYYEPAMRAADELGLETPLARAQLYDTAIQHGDGLDPDGLAALIERTNQRVGHPGDITEATWLSAFFDVRIDDLTDPHNQQTADAWRESLDRVECMRSIAETANTNLEGPIHCTVHGDRFTID